VGPSRHHRQRAGAGLLPVEDDQGPAVGDGRGTDRHAPLNRLGDDEDLKGAAVLFASDAGKHITGQILAVDGGVSAV
jgi:gluconate 5-dehydrogenase